MPKARNRLHVSHPSRVAACIVVITIPRVALERAGSASGARPGDCAVDEAIFADLVADLGAEHIGEVCRLFLANAAAGVEDVRRALDAGDKGGAAVAAHRLKSASGFLGATRLAHLCAAVEAGSSAGDAGGVLTAELRRIAVDLDRLVGRAAPPGHPAA